MRTSALIVSFAASVASLAHAAIDPTFSKDIAPIFQRSCDNCHRAGSIAPMSLLTYKDARPWARSIKEKVVARARCRPGTSTATSASPNSRTIPRSPTPKSRPSPLGWIAARPQGNPADLPPPRQFSDLDKWHIGKPDLVVSMPKPYILQATWRRRILRHRCRSAASPKTSTSRRWKPSPTLGFKVVHHADTNLVEDPEEDPVGLFLNEYAVGKNADIFPARTPAA